MADMDRTRYDELKDNMARRLAIIALVISIIALFWAIKADNRAGDALEQAESVTVPTETVP